MPLCFKRCARAFNMRDPLRRRLFGEFMRKQKVQRIAVGDFFYLVLYADPFDVSEKYHFHIFLFAAINALGLVARKILYGSVFLGIAARGDVLRGRGCEDVGREAAV